MKIYVSPSSQEANVWENYNEEVQMNKVADILCPELTRHGIEWMRNNRANTFSQHVAESNAYRPNYHLAIHTNAGGGHGCTSFCLRPEINNLGTQFATNLFNQITAISPWAGRGVRATLMDEVEKTIAPACLIEIEFHDNREGADWIMGHIPEIAKALLLGILKQVGIEYIPPVVPIDYKALYEAEKLKNADLSEKLRLEIAKSSGLYSQINDPNTGLLAQLAAQVKKVGELTTQVNALNNKIDEIRKARNTLASF